MAATATSLRDERRRARTAPGVREWLQAGGWHVVKGTAHRGVLHPDEYVDEMRVLIQAERHLGFTIADLWEVYAQGRKSAAQREVRARIDARLLEIADAGGNMELLAGVFEVDRKTIGRALARAREVREEAA
jgi:hypothetical protein